MTALGYILLGAIVGIFVGRYFRAAPWRLAEADEMLVTAGRTRARMVPDEAIRAAGARAALEQGTGACKPGSAPATGGGES